MAGKDQSRFDNDALPLHKRAMKTPDVILRRVGNLIVLSSRDYEAASARAEELRIEVLQAIADGAPNAVEMAKAALRTIEQDVGGR